MEHQNHSGTVLGRPFRIPVIVWVLGAGLLIALAAIFIFGVSARTVGYYAFFAFMMGSHFFIHGGHGGHNQQGLDQNRSAIDSPSKDERAGHSGGCH